MTMNMVGVNSKQSKDGRSIIEGGLKEESSYTATDLLEDINALNEPSISDEGVTPGSSINGAQSQPTTRSDSKKSMIKFFYSYYGDHYFNLKYHGLSLMTAFQFQQNLQIVEETIDLLKHQRKIRTAKRELKRMMNKRT